MDVDLIQSLVRLLEVKDFSTAAHTWRVVLYTRALAEQAGLSHELTNRLAYGAALHDIGKLELPDAVLQKPGPLTDAEFQIVKGHAAHGHQRLISAGETDPVVLALVRHHHERWDGLGYPDGLAGEAIPMAPRYFAVVDTFDALTSVRPYRNDIGPDAARRAVALLREGSGTRYCPDAVRRFVALFDTGQIDWVLEHFNDERDVPGYVHLPQAGDFAARAAGGGAGAAGAQHPGARGSGT